jgi:hypothetical protein
MRAETQYKDPVRQTIANVEHSKDQTLNNRGLIRFPEIVGLYLSTLSIESRK